SSDVCSSDLRAQYGLRCRSVGSHQPGFVVAECDDECPASPLLTFSSHLRVGGRQSARLLLLHIVQSNIGDGGMTLIKSASVLLVVLVSTISTARADDSTTKPGVTGTVESVDH